VLLLGLGREAAVEVALKKIFDLEKVAPHTRTAAGRSEP
jgi:hypothetical protein